MSTKNYYNQEAIEKLKSLAESARICMMTSQLDDRPIAARPMTLQEVDNQGRLWFISSKDGDKHYGVESGTDIQLYFMNTGSSEYLSIYGKAEIYTDQATIDEHWSKMAEAWFENGKNDTNVSIIAIRPEDVRYWDTKNGKLADMALMLYAAVTGDTSKNDAGIEGELNV